MNTTLRRARIVTVLGLLFVGSVATETAAQELRYQWKPGQQFVYEVEITVDTGQSISTFKGNLRYTVDSATNEQLRVTYNGGLPESSKAKETTGRRPGGPPFGPPGFGGPRGFGGPPGFPSPFGRATFSGKFVTTNRITLTPRGVALAMEGDSQLPYLLGNASLIPFETLPESKNQQWTIDSGVSITEGEDDRRPFGPFGPFGRSDNKSVQAASEKTTYAIQSEDADQVVVAKTYHLSTPKTADQEAFDLNGSGTWTFDKKQSLSKSLEFNQKLVVREGNTDVTFPITIKYHLLTATELAKLEADAKRQREEHEKRLAEAKQQAEAPLSAEEKQKSLTALKSGDATQVIETLKQLSSKTPKDPDPEIMASLRGLLSNRNKQIQDDAHKTLINWSPDYKRTADINNEYKSHMPVKSTDRAPTESNPLYVGQIVQAHLNRAFWYAAEVLELLPDGRVMVRSRGLGAREHTVPRRDIQLAPDEVEQPVQRPATQVASAQVATGQAAAGMRTWSDSTGEHKIQATFLAVEQGKVKMRRADGKEISVPLDRLSKADQAFAEQAQSATKKPTNPFE